MEEPKFLIKAITSKTNQPGVQYYKSPPIKSRRRRVTAVNENNMI
jgi:hypothetical protein